jgi:hypothetical protein
MITYITAFIDINRTNWSQFTRSFEDYYKSFEPFFKLFDSRTCESDNMIVFIDQKHYSFLHKKMIELPYITNIILIPITTDDLPKWKYIEREFEIMNDINFISKLGERTHFPEHNYPEYTLINHSKIDLICLAIEKYEKKNQYFSWVDFGYFSKEQNIPIRLLDINKLDKDRINYSLINPIEKQDFDINYTLMNAPEVVGGFWFFGPKDAMISYQKLYMDVFLEFQNNCIADDDQHLVLQCYHKNPNLFSFVKHIYGWHKILKLYQKQPLKVISFCLWGNEKRYVVGLIKNIELAKLYYPDWKCFIYIHISAINQDMIDQLELFDNISVIIKSDENIRNKRFMLWRFEPIVLYPAVEYFMSRDIDTRIQPREVLAVNEWIESGKILHIMRDHPQHYPKILGGMYGIKCSGVYNLQNDWIQTIENFYKENGEHTDDQFFLYTHVYDKFNSSDDRIIHDEIKRYEGVECKNFPLKYEQNWNFVGCYIYEDGTTDPQTSEVLKKWLYNNLPDRIASSNVTIEEKLYYIKNTISNIYIMHYTKLVSRKKNMKKELRRNLLDIFFNIKWVENFDREKISISDIQNSCVLDPNILNRRMTLGEIANAMGHKYIYEQIFKNDDIALVLEDDTIFKPNFIDHLYLLLNYLPCGWEQICLGGPTVENKIPAKTLKGSIRMDFKSEEVVFYRPETPAPCTLSCMLHNKKSVTKILKSQYIKKLTAPSDHNLWAVNIDQRVNIYWAQPWITYEGSKTDMFDTSLDRGF